jgi:hypothetical protein
MPATSVHTMIEVRSMFCYLLSPFEPHSADAIAMPRRATSDPVRAIRSYPAPVCLEAHSAAPMHARHGTKYLQPAGHKWWFSLNR